MSVIVLAKLSVLRNLLSEALLPVGIVLVIIGAGGLGLYAFNWLREPIILVASWMLIGFGVAHWLTTADAGSTVILSSEWSGVGYLLCLGVAFVGVYLTGQPTGLLERSARWWPALPAAAFLILGIIITAEVRIGREILGDILLPLIPILAVLWAAHLWKQVQVLSATND